MVAVHQQDSTEFAEVWELDSTGRAGQTFGESGPGSGDTGAVDALQVKDKVRRIPHPIPIHEYPLVIAL